MVRVLVFFAIVVAAPLLVAQDEAGSAWQLTLRLSQVRRQTAKALQDQPDYTCLATFDRYRWLVNEPAERKLDTVRVEVAYVGGRELYSWPGAGKFSDAPLSSMVGVGLMGDGDFAVHAHNIFVSGIGAVTWAGEEQGLGSRKLWRWNYRISPYQSRWSVQSGGSSQTVGSEGSFWVDPQTLDLVRMETHATDFFSAFPLKAVLSTVDYGRVHIGEQDVLLPLHAELKTTTSDGSESRNQTDYSGCRQYAGQSTISFGAPPEPAAAPPAPAPMGTVEAQLPAGLAIHIRLSDGFPLSRAAVGSAVEGTLAAPLLDAGKELAPKGAAVRGRVRLLTQDSTAGTLPGMPEKFTELGLVFDELEFPGHLYRFAAMLKSFDTVVPGVRMDIIQERGGVAREALSPTKFPGVSVFFLDSRSSGLPKGTLMTWTTK